MKAKKIFWISILTWIALFSFNLSARGGVNDTNQLTVTTEGGFSQTIEDHYTINSAGTYTFTGNYEANIKFARNVITVSTSEAVAIILNNATINLTSTAGDCRLIRINDNSQVTLKLQGNNTLQLTKNSDIHQDSGAAIEVCQSASLTIQSADNNDANGKLTVKSIGGNWGGAAIGSAAGKAGNHTRAGAITINSGTIDAESSRAAQGAAAIGGGLQGDATSITINGGVITARGGDGGNTGAGIGGGGNQGAGGEIEINGGYVIAMGGTGGSTASGIGGGNGRNNHGTFSTGTNGNAVIIASSIGDQSKKESSWSGLIFEGDEGKIYGNGNTFTLSQDIEIPVGKKLTISEGQSLNVSSYTLTNNGTIINRGTINGTVGGSGTVIHQTKLKEEMISPIEPVDYNGQAQTPVTIEGYEVGTDYMLSGSNNIDVAEATAENPPTVTVTPKEGGKLYGDPIAKTFTIQRKSLSFTFNGIDSPIPYDGAEHEATVTPNVVGGDNVTTTLSYKKKEANDTFSDIGGKPKDAGTYKVIVSQISGEKASNYAIDEAHNSKEFVITKATPTFPTDGAWTVSGKAYDGTAISVDKPTLTGIGGAAISSDEVILTYYLSDGTTKTTATNSGAANEGAAPVWAGSYQVKANYAGNENFEPAETSATFAITQATNSWTTQLKMNGWIYGQTPNDPSAEAAQGNVSYTYYKKTADSEEYVSLDAKPTNAGTWYVQASVTGVANYNDLTSGYVAFVIAKATPTITLNVPTTAEDLIYDGTPKTVTAQISGVEGESVSLSVTLSYQQQTGDNSWEALQDNNQPTNAGIYRAVATFAETKNYNATSSNSNKFEITKAPTAIADIILPEDKTYDGNAIVIEAPAVTGGTLSNRKAALSYFLGETQLTSAPVNAGSYTVKATYEGNANHKEAMKTADFTIQPKELTAEMIKLSDTEFTYNGRVQQPTVTVKDGNTQLTADTDYTLEWPQESKTAGSYTVKITGKGNYKEEIEKTFSIAPKSITSEGISIMLSAESFTYNGSAQQPTVTVNDGNTQLTADTDYTLEWPQESKAAGNYTVKITGKGNYTGEKTMSYSIAKATPPYEVPTGLTATYGQILAEVTLPNGWTWEEADTTPVGNVGKNPFHAKFTPEDTDNYNVVEQVEVSILVSAADPNFTFAEPSLTITQGEEVPANALTKPEDCTVTYSSDNEKVATVDTETGEVTVVGVGTAIITATAGGNYTGTATYTLTVKAAYNPPSDPVYYTVTIPTEVTGAIIHDGGTHEVEAYTYLTFRIELDPNGSGAYPQVTGLWGEILTPDSEGNYRLYVTGDTEVTIGEVTDCSYYLMTLPQETVEESDSTFWSAEGIEVVGAAAVPAMRAVSDSETCRFMAPFGTIVTLRPIETAERKFLQWENGSTERERTLTLRADEEIRALWQKVSAVGIEEIAANSLIRGERGQLYIEVPASCDAIIYNYNGVPVRVAHLTEGANRIHSLNAGLYLVQIGQARAVPVRVR